MPTLTPTPTPSATPTHTPNKWGRVLTSTPAPTNPLLAPTVTPSQNGK